MDHPDWYPDWRHEAFHQLQEKLDRLWKEFRLGEWPRYDYDLDAGTLVFSDGGVPRVIAEVQIVGSTSFKAGNWLWAWANAHWPAERVTDSGRVRAFGEEHGIRQLTHQYLTDGDLNSLGWTMAAVMVRVTDALGAYRPPDDSGALFLTYKSIAWAS
jgi:hypothetical protein